MRLSTALVAMLLLASGARGQGPIASAERGGGPASDTGAAVAADEFGNVVLVGTLDDVGTFGGLTLATDETGCVFFTCHDAYVVKYDASGTALWARRMGTPVHNDFGAGVTFAGGPFFNEDADILVSGYFTGIATWDGGTNPGIELTTRSDFDAFLARYTASGDLLWVIQAGGTDEDTGRGVASDGDGNAYWTGSFRGAATFGEGDAEVTLQSAGSTDGFVARIDPDGSLKWVVAVGGEEGADTYDAAVPSPQFSDDSFVYVAGTFNGVGLVGETPLQSRGLGDGYIAKLNSEDGTVMWARQVGGSKDDHLRGVTVAQGNGGEIVVGAGWFNGQTLVGTDVLTSAGLSDVFVVALSTEGTELWGRRGGGSGGDIAQDVYGVVPPPIVTRGGRAETPPIYVTGFIDDTVTFDDASGNTLTVAAQNQDGFLAAYAPSASGAEASGDLRTVIALGGPNNDSGRGVAGTTSFDVPAPGDSEGNGGYAVVAGTFNGTATLFGETIQSAGSSDAFVARQATCPGLFCYGTADEPPPEASGVRLSVAPHPATPTSILSLTLERPLALRLDLFDARGRRLATLLDGPQATGERSVPLPPLAPGTYLLRTTTAEGAHSRVVTVAR